MRGRRVRPYRGSLVVRQRLGPVVVARDRQLVSSSCLCAQRQTAGVSDDLTLRASSRPLAKRLPLHLIARGTFDGTRSTISPPTAHSRRRRIPSSAAIWMLDPSRFGAREGGSNSAVVSAESRSGRRNDSSGTRLGRIRPLGDDSTSTGDGSTFFASKAAAATRCDSRSNPACGDLVSDNCTCGFEVIASLGRRRTSTVNEGTARLNVVLDTAHRRADSSRRRRPCEAKRNKAIGDYRGDKRAISAAPVARTEKWRGSH